MRRSHSGFTLVELVMVLAILLILLSLALPSMAALSARSNLTATHNLLVSSFNTARHGAVTSGWPVVICPGDRHAGCRSDGDWSQGWLVYVERGAGRRPELDSDVLHVGQALPGGIRGLSGRGRSRARFRPDGSAGGTNLTLRLCADGEVQSALILSNAGRIRTASAGERARLPACDD